MASPSQRKKAKMTKIDKAIMFAPIFATGVGIGAKKIYDLYKSKQNEKMRSGINERLRTVTPVIRQHLEDFEKNKTSDNQELQKIKELQELAQKQKIEEQNIREAEENRLRLEKVRQQAIILENQKQQKDDFEKQKRRILEQKLIEELKNKQLEREKKLEEEKKIIETQKMVAEEQQIKIQQMTEQKDFLEEMKYHSVALLKQLRKTKKDNIFVEQLIQNIPKSSSDNFTSQVCKIYSNINKKTYEECNKPYVQDIDSCIKRSNIRYNMDPDIVNTALNKLKCN